MAGGEEVVFVFVEVFVERWFVKLEFVVLVVGWMTDVGSVDPAFKPRSLAIDGFTDLQYIKQGTCHFSTVTQRCYGLQRDSMQVETRANGCALIVEIKYFLEHA